MVRFQQNGFQSGVLQLERPSQAKTTKLERKNRKKVSEAKAPALVQRLRLAKDEIAGIFFALWVTQDGEGRYHCTMIAAGTIRTHHVRTPSSHEEWRQTLRKEDLAHVRMPSDYTQLRQDLTKEEQAYVRHLSSACYCGLKANQWLDGEGRCFSENWVCPWCDSELPSHVCRCKDDEIDQYADPFAVELYM